MGQRDMFTFLSNVLERRTEDLKLSLHVVSSGRDSGLYVKVGRATGGNLHPPTLPITLFFLYLFELLVVS